MKYLRVLRGAEVTSTPVNAANSDDGDDDDPPQDWLAHRRVTCPEEGRFLVVSVGELIELTWLLNVFEKKLKIK